MKDLLVEPFAHASVSELRDADINKHSGIIASGDSYNFYLEEMFPLQLSVRFTVHINPVLFSDHRKMHTSSCDETHCTTCYVATNYVIGHIFLKGFLMKQPIWKCFV